MSSLPDAAQFSAPGPPSLREPDAALFVERLQALGSRALIANVEAEAVVEQAGGHALPVIVTDGAIGMSYIAAPHSVYALYPRAELDLVDLGWMRMPAAAANARHQPCGADRQLVALHLPARELERRGAGRIAAAVGGALSRPLSADPLGR